LNEQKVLYNEVNEQKEAREAEIGEEKAMEEQKKEFEARDAKIADLDEKLAARNHST